MSTLPTTSTRTKSAPKNVNPHFHGPLPIRLQKVLHALEGRGVRFDCASEYGEPGYSTDKPLILFANWNHFDSREMEAIESQAEIEWSDEWEIIHDSGPDNKFRSRAFRSSPDSYGWERSYFMTEDCELVAFDSLPDSGESLLSELRDFGFITEVYEGSGGKMELDGIPETRKAVPSRYSESDLESIASLIEDDCQTGFHPGQNDRPEDKLKSAGPGEYLFRIAGKGQFDITWQVWKIRPEAEENSPCPQCGQFHTTGEGAAELVDCLYVQP